jgi:hypothetical protein
MTAPTDVDSSPTGRPAWHLRHRRLVGLAGAVTAAGMAALWIVVVPDKAAESDGLQSLTIRLGHPLSWALLSSLGLAVAADAPRRVREAMAWSGLAAYAAFLLALLW